MLMQVSTLRVTKPFIFTALFIILLLQLTFLVSKANWQSEISILGVSTNLKNLGITEYWHDDTSQNLYCQTRLYEKDTWTALSTDTIVETDPKKEAAFQERCKLQGQDLIDKAALKDIDWQPVPRKTAPESVLDDKGNLLKTPDFPNHTYPQTQQVVYDLTAQSPWEFIVETVIDNSLKPDADMKDSNPGYDMGLRPQKEPVPYQVVHGKYDTDSDQILLSPMQMMKNTHYGVAVLMFRDYRTGTDGLDYRYRPYFFTLPQYQVMPLQDAMDKLDNATEYAMNLDDLDRGPNVNQLGYRAYCRVKGEVLPVQVLLDHLANATPAGKLYWLMLLCIQVPDQYAPVAQHLLQSVLPSRTVIVTEGSDWSTHSFQEVLLDQSDVLNIELKAHP